MRLVSFRATNYRNVLDSDTVAVEPDVTCLVGKNEAGKTTLLSALHRLNPSPPAGFSVQDDYPRWRLIPDRKRGDLSKVQPITATFALEVDDHAAVEAQVGANVLLGEQLELSRSYEGKLTWDLKSNEAQAVANLLALHDLSAAARKLVEQQKTFRALASAIAQVRASADTPPDVAEQLNTVDQASAALIGDQTYSKVITDLVFSRIPLFFYFSTYSILPGRINLDELSGRDDPATSDLQTARALLQLAETDPARLGADDYESRKAELEAVSNELTHQVFEYWTQNTELQVSIDVDKETVQEPTGQTAVARYLDVRVHDRRHGYTGNFGQRSSGFQWFFSFLAAFSEFENVDRQVIVLLDEPALGLHARAQADFLRFINERLAPSSQVLYTTHSPFMIETGLLNRVRIVEDHGPDQGAKVSDEVLATDRDSLFPLQAALGYDIAQSLFIGADNLLVEGTSDYTYLTVLSDHLKSLGRQGLDERWTIVPVGGGSNVATFVALLGHHLDVTVLIDSATTGSQRIVDLTKRGQLDAKSLVTVGEITTTKNADIEDLFVPSDYLRLYDGAFAAKTKVGDLPPGDRIVKRVAELRGVDFDHGVPADFLLRERADELPRLASGTVDRFEQLFTRLNSTLPSPP